MNPGSWINYLYEITIVGSISASLLLRKRSKKLKSFVIIFLLLQFFIYIEKEPRTTSFFENYKKYPPLVNLQADQKILSYVKSVEGKVYAENKLFCYLANKRVPLSVRSLIELKNLGLINEKGIVDHFKKENYSLIAYYKKDRIPSLKKLDTWVKENYKLIDEVDWMELPTHQKKWKVYKKI
jgi:hypothetical protein